MSHKEHEKQWREVKPSPFEGLRGTFSTLSYLLKEAMIGVLGEERYYKRRNRSKRRRTSNQ